MLEKRVQFKLENEVSSDMNYFLYLECDTLSTIQFILDP